MTRIIDVGTVKIGGDNPVAVQSMTNTDTKNVKATVAQISVLEQNGCDLVRLSLYDMECIPALKEILKQVSIPLIADVHFDYKIALAAIEAGIHKIRINPGNIGSDERIREVSRAAREKGVPIRVGANSGSVPKELLQKYGGVNENSMVEAALANVSVLEKNGFEDICISVKCSDVPLMIKCYERIASKCQYPLHLGVTEAGTLENSTIKSSIGIGSLLLKGIGDTIRVSVTGDPAREPIIARKILKACGMLDEGINVISCPTCARTGIDVLRIADMVEKQFGHVKDNLTIAVMGCVVNGPGEAKDADIGIAGGKGGFVIFKNGQVYKTCKNDTAALEFLDEIKKMIN